MRNLKKILSLALALVMVFSLVTFASAKDFSDADAIEHTEAVEVLTALEVIDGVGNNTFNPAGKVTRAQMAKMITLIALGNVSVEAFKGTVTDLTDINGHWAEAYIKYCYSQGIISGKGSGKFDPDAYVTTAEAAKMLLVAIGYNSSVQVYEGPQWNINVIRDAQTNDIFDELALANDLQINRDQAAQMMYNALTTGVIIKTSEVSRVDGSIIDSYAKSKGANKETLLGNSFKGQVWVGSFVGNNDFKSEGNPAKGEIAVKGALEASYVAGSGTAAAFPYDYDIANIGEEVKVIFKDGTMGTKGQPDKNDTIYGVYKTGSTTVVTGTKGTVKDQKSDKAQINIDGNKYDLNETAPSGSSTVVTVWTNFNTSSTYTLAQVKGDDKNNSQLTKDLKGDNGDVVKAIIQDGKVTTIYVTTSKIAAVTAVNSEKVTMNNGVGSIEFEGNDVYDGIAKGDVVVVTTLYADNAYDDDAYNIVTKAEVVSGEVSGYKGTENVVVAGTTYKIYGKAPLLASIPGQSTVVTSFEDKNIGETADLFLVNGYVGAAVQTSESASNYSVIIDVNDGDKLGGGFGGLEILVMDAAGTKTTLTVADDSKDADNSTPDPGDFDVGDIVVWSGTEKDATVTIKGNVATGTKSYKEGTKAFDGVVTTSDCVLFVQTEANKAANAAGTKFKAYNIRDVKDFTVSSAEYAVAEDTNNRVVAVFANLKSTPGGATGSTVYGIVSAYAGRRTVNGTSYYQYTVQDNEQSYTLNMKTNTAISKGDLVYFDPASDSVYSGNDVKKLENNPKAQAVYVDEYDGNDRILTFFTNITGTAGEYVGNEATQDTLALDDDCIIVFVDVDGDKATADIGINEFDKIKGYKNVAIVTETQGSDEVIIALLVETSNKADILAVADKLPDDAGADDIKDQLDKYGSVTVEGDLPAGDYGYDPDDPSSTVEVTLGGESTEITGESSIYGDAIVDSDVTLGASGNLTVIEMTLNAGKTLTVTDGSTFNFRTINMKAGSEIEFAASNGTRTITFLAKADLSIYMEDGYVKSGTTEIAFDADGGLNAALLAVNSGAGGAGSDSIGTWY